MLSDREMDEYQFFFTTRNPEYVGDIIHIVRESGEVGMTVWRMNADDIGKLMKSYFYTLLDIDICLIVFCLAVVKYNSQKQGHISVIDRIEDCCMLKRVRRKFG